MLNSCLANFKAWRNGQIQEGQIKYNSIQNEERQMKYVDCKKVTNNRVKCKILILEKANI